MRRVLGAIATAILLAAGVWTASPAEAAGKFSSSAAAISDTGWIVGEVHVANTQRCVEDGENVCVHAAIFATDHGRVGIRDLGTLGGPSSRFLGVNNYGAIVGAAETAKPEPDFGGFIFRAVLSSRGGPLVDLGTLGGRNSQAQAISDHGVVVGQAQTAAGAFHAFTKHPGQPMADLGALGGGFSAATGISRDGHYITGFSATATGALRGFLWDGFKLRQLDPLPGGTFSRGNSVNGFGDVVGTSSDAKGNIQAVIWQHGGVRKLLDYGAGFARGMSIADSGVVTGFTALPNGKLRAFKTDAWGGPKQLLPALGQDATAFSVTNEGDAVGDSTVGKLDPNGHPRYDAVLYTAGRVIDLAT